VSVSWCPVNRVAASLPARARPPSAVSRRDGCRGNGSLRSHVPRHPPAAIVSPLPGARGLVGGLPAPKGAPTPRPSGVGFFLVSDTLVSDTLEMGTVLAPPVAVNFRLLAGCLTFLRFHLCAAPFLPALLPPLRGRALAGPRISENFRTF
jgi:hypothetical protein